jgi:anti-sigma-K factor RskA
MKHLSEEELIGYREGHDAQRGAITGHLEECAECRAELARLNAELSAVFAALDALAVPDPGAEYGQQVWRRIAPQLAPRRPRLRVAAGRTAWWREWFSPRPLLAAAAVAALVLVAFFAGRRTKPTAEPEIASRGGASMREKVLLLAVGEHLGRSEMMLTELSNTEVNRSQVKLIDISAEQKRAEDLLRENRLYRQTAMEEGDTAVASVLDELERVLLDVSHTPDQVSAAQLLSIQQRIAADGILFKVRVVGQQLEQRQRATPAGSNGLQENRKKV